MRKWFFILASGLVAAGCSSKLETGYQPDKLDMSLAQRKALYADPFSPEAAEAQKGGGGGDEQPPPHEPMQQGPGSY